MSRHTSAIKAEGQPPPSRNSLENGGSAFNVRCVHRQIVSHQAPTKMNRKAGLCPLPGTVWSRGASTLDSKYCCKHLQTDVLSIWRQRLQHQKMKLCACVLCIYATLGQTLVTSSCHIQVHNHYAMTSSAFTIQSSHLEESKAGLL